MTNKSFVEIVRTISPEAAERISKKAAELR
jgi:hypothetical protein